MILASLVVFLIPVLIGSLSIHLLWPERGAMALLLKLALGVGLGLGLSSILYFLGLIIVPGRINMLIIQAPLLAALAALAVVRERGRPWSVPPRLAFSRLQWSLIAVLLIAAGVFSASLGRLAYARAQGGFDAWSIWNRAARFIHRDPENWRATLSADLHWQTHPDYPLLIPLNVAWVWQVIGEESVRVPMLQGLLFTAAGPCLMFAAVALTRTLGQASLAALVLMSTPVFILAGSGMVADVPVMYFMFAAGLLMYLSTTLQRPALLGLAGWMAGLAAWTKNEGLLFVIAAPVALAAFNPGNVRRSLTRYTAGLVIPLAAALYLKTITPANDLFRTGPAELAAMLTDLSRYRLILSELGVQAMEFGNWPFSILLALTAYALVMGANAPAGFERPGLALGLVLLLQLLGYLAIYVISPHDLNWHLATSLYRLILQIYPSAIFLLFTRISEPETVFARAR